MRQHSPTLEIGKSNNTARNKNREGYRRSSKARARVAAYDQPRDFFRRASRSDCIREGPLPKRKKEKSMQSMV